MNIDYINSKILLRNSDTRAELYNWPSKDTLAKTFELQQAVAAVPDTQKVTELARLQAEEIQAAKVAAASSQRQKSRRGDLATAGPVLEPPVPLQNSPQVPLIFFSHSTIV